MSDLTNRLNTLDYDPPMGDIFSYRKLSGCHSIWTAPLPGEEGAPTQRIIHARVYKPHGKTRVDRVGIQNARGFHKCGSAEDNDWIRDLRILTLDDPNGDWREILYERERPLQEDGDVRWLDLEGLETYGLILEIRRCGIDDWWTPWNLAVGAFLLEGEALKIAPRKENTLKLAKLDLEDLPEGLTVSRQKGEVRYRSDFLEVGFSLSRSGFTYLAIDQEGRGETQTNLLKVPAGSFQQGTFLAPIGQSPIADRAVRFRFTGTLEVSGKTLRYDLQDPASGLTYTLEWTVEPTALHFRARRKSETTLRAWQSTAWAWTLSPGAAACHALGRPEASGQTGLLETPLVLHAPRHGSLITACKGSGRFRCEVYRPLDRIDWEFKIGEEPGPNGDWILPAGEFEAHWTFQVARPEFHWQPDTPEVVQKALRKAGHTGMNFRADTATLTNNGASINCPVSMDSWTAQTNHMGDLLPDLPFKELIRFSLQRWLDLGPGYASGHMKEGNQVHDAEDEYLQTPAAGLVGLGDYLRAGAPGGWLEQYQEPIRRKLKQMQARDLDGDGLIESPYRTGISGTGQWSTCWYDVTSYGWKDAWSNAVLYEALTQFLELFPDTCLEDWLPQLEDWTKKLKTVYRDTFFNASTGWLAGWRCKEDRIHDYAFLPPNGCAVAVGLIDPEEGKTMLSRLWKEMQRVGVPDPAFGLPANLHCIPDQDLSDIMQGFPFGYYQNGGRTHAQTRHFLRGLYVAGLTEEADQLLHDLCRGFAEETVFAGCYSGVDWRFWDGRPCGYEGLLTDQFGFLGEALKRYGSQPHAGGEAVPVSCFPSHPARYPIDR